MTQQNADLILRAYEAFGRGDLGTVFSILSPGITWHVPGRSPLSGDYTGHEQVGGFFARTMELSGGTFTIDITGVLPGPGPVVVVLCTVAAEHDGQSWSSPEVQVWKVEGGQAVDFREFQGDEHTEDEFWSAAAASLDGAGTGAAVGTAG
jgi:ketosteroid isomerase-like protein